MLHPKTLLPFSHRTSSRNPQVYQETWCFQTYSGLHSSELKSIGRKENIQQMKICWENFHRESFHENMRAENQNIQATIFIIISRYETFRAIESSPCSKADIDNYISVSFNWIVCANWHKLSCLCNKLKLQTKQCSSSKSQMPMVLKKVNEKESSSLIKR